MSGWSWTSFADGGAFGTMLVLAILVAFDLWAAVRRGKGN